MFHWLKSFFIKDKRPAPVIPYIPPSLLITFDFTKNLFFCEAFWPPDMDKNVLIDLLPQVLIKLQTGEYNNIIMDAVKVAGNRSNDRDTANRIIENLQNIVNNQFNNGDVPLITPDQVFRREENS